MNPNRLLILFLSINILNYVDRQVLSGVFPLVKEHFLLSDAALGLLGSAFMITYSLTSIPFGRWADRWMPHKVAAIGVAVWSIATVSSALAWSFASLFVFRALIGVGEAAYVSTAGTILSNAYPERKRSAILGLFNLGMPIGGALGVVLGGWLGVRYGWQWAFFIVGVPGLILAYVAWHLKLPRMQQQTPKKRGGFGSGDLISLLTKNKPFLYTCLGYAGISFAFGAIVLFVPTFFERSFGYSLEKATLYAGGLQVGAGLLGAPIGGFIADFWLKRNGRGRAYTLVVSMCLSALFLWAGLFLESFVAFFFSAFFMLWHVGVATALVFDVTDKAIWNTAAAVAMFVMHFLGDIPSPVIVGLISDSTSLLFAFSLLPIPMLLASFFFWKAGTFLPTRPA